MSASILVVDDEAGLREFLVDSLELAGYQVAAAAIAAGPRGQLAAKEPGLFERWVADQHGQAGLRRLAALAPSTAAYLTAHGGLDGAQQAFAATSA